MTTKYQLLVSLLLSLSAGGAANTVWHIASNGSDTETCGSLYEPCATLTRAVQLSSDGDTIVILASGTDRSSHFFTECNNTLVNKTLTIAGRGGLPSIGCPYSDPVRSGALGAIMTIRPEVDRAIKVVFHGVQLTNGYVFVSDADLVLSSSHLRDAALRSHVTCDRLTMHVDSSNIGLSRPYFREDLTAFDTSLMCRHLVANITNTTSNDVNINLDGSASCHVTISDCTFRKLYALETGLGGVNISVAQDNGSVTVKRCLFEKFVHYDPVLSSINIESSVLRIESVWASPDSGVTATIDITDSVFRDNERAVSISRNFKNISIARCRFERNTVMHAAAAVRLAIGVDDHVTFTEVTFDGNNAGHNRHASVPGKFDYDGFQIQIREKRVNGIISLVGKGGAVRIHRGRVRFVNCTFTNNTASLLGGTIFIAKNGSVELNSCTFVNTDVGKHSMQGDVLYSSGSVLVINSTFLTRTASDHISILRHSGHPWSMDVRSMWFECPVGYRLLIVNATSHRIEPKVGLIRSNKLDQLYYYCQTCGNNQYSVNRGYVNFTVTTDVDHFYTLLINGQQPFDSHPVHYEFGNITCRECPYGGDCERDIRAVANFWGYRHRDGISFQHCPQDYCCTTTHCSGIDECAAYRHGTLCGRCVAGYSESLFSSACVPNYRCKSYWILVALAIIGVAYTVFLLSQKELRDFVASGSWELICCQRETNRTKPKRECEQMLTAVGGRSLRHADSGGGLKSAPPDRKGAPKSRNAGTLIILFYYFQDSFLLHMDTIYTRTTSKFVKRLKNFLVGLFWFRLDFFQFLEDVCIFPDFQPVEKLLFKVLFVPYVILLLGLVFVIQKLYRSIQKSILCPQSSRTSVRRQDGCMNSDAPQDGATSSSFSCRLASGFTLAMLFTYQKMATATFALLNCVPIGNASVLYMDGSIVCFEGWQYGVMLFAGLCVGPFSLIVMFGPPLLKNRTITVFHFCIGCLLPLPSLIYWFYRHLVKSRRNDGRRIRVVHGVGERRPSSCANPADLDPATTTILEVLQGPFKDSPAKGLVGQLCWAGVLVARRLILFICYTFINDVLVRMLSMICVCFVILMHHMHVKPYKDNKSNLAGAFSASALLVVGVINLIRACFEAAEYIPQGPYKILMNVCEYIENTLVLWLPLAGVTLILTSILVRLVAYLGNKRHVDKDPR